MNTSLVAADSLICIDVGSVHTRAVLFDVVEGRYRFLASGSSPTTAGLPFRDIGEGIHRALEALEVVTGRVLLGDDERLIIPSQPDGAGVDGCVATLSAGAPLKVVAVGLLEDVSAESARHLATMTYAQVAETFSLNDRRKSDARLDAILRLRPDLIIVAGGTDEGASQSVLSVLESIGLACYLFPEGQRPDVLFAGNQALEGEIKSAMESFASLHMAPNIRPALEFEQLGPALARLNDIYRLVRARKLAGVNDLELLTGGTILPTGAAFGRMIAYYSAQDTTAPALGIDLGASSVTVAAALAGDLSLSIYPDLGMGAPLAGILNTITLDEIGRWLTLESSASYVRDYLHSKVAYPASLPQTPEDLAIEQALARLVIQAAVKRASQHFPKKVARPWAGLLPVFEPIVAAGGALANAPNPGQGLLMVLDALQPTSNTVVCADQNNIVAALGAAAAVNPVLTVQMSQMALQPLASVISPVGKANYGTSILRVKVKFSNGNTTKLEIKHGALEVIPVPLLQKVELEMEPLHGFDVGRGPGRKARIEMPGGMMGVVIDARGRPLHLPADPARRRELFKKWSWTLGG
jgi:uncharacterized protein (TIGR01319 family)